MSIQTGQWQVVSWMNARCSVIWGVRRDRFAGVDWLLDENGARRTFRTRRTAQKAADSKNAKATGEVT